MKEVRQSLGVQQMGYCAYCEQKMSTLVFVEHYLSRHSHKSQELDFENFLGCCSGKLYNDRMGGQHIEICNVSKKRTQLRIDPRIKQHVDNIYYEGDATIRSGDKDHDADLKNVLNLNTQELKDKRNAQYKSTWDIMIRNAKSLKLTKTDSYSKGLKIAQAGTMEFSGYVSYRYRNLIDS